jgi:simple sugar transport system ATP-binding protein
VRVLVLDEPTSSLDADEVAELFRVIRDLKDRGVAILFVSHFLDQVYEICDRVTVLRDGALVGEYLTGELLRIDLVQKMLGRNAADLTVRSRGMADLLAAPADLRGARHRPGAIAGSRPGHRGGRGARVRRPSGLGADRACAGRERRGSPGHRHHLVQRRRAHPAHPRQAIATGIAYSSENRKAEGIIDQLTVRENITLAPAVSARDLAADQHGASA